MKKIAILCITTFILFAGISLLDNEEKDMSLSNKIQYLVSDPGGMG
ncbi:MULTISPECIES: hypothetical protein [Bacillus]|jgi:hypothetical protein|uniref:Phr family secreted Rap phosphatase inhibitor n=2 Tax=Bacillus cereus group TaxID=86661 RepID=J8HIA7_BACCE|nr:MULTISPECIES: hypothetical protein [Bacillus]MBK5360563.1 hypothetical protein [Bacillus sp. TH44]EJP83691.1 hypothetical protein IC3_05136 [Bacillus cereus VD142]EJR27418.1 hypothetical protein IIG_04877 [Bacillus cereus VD048]EJR30893.1 hypothetical protein III_05516 [Bacillus mycoides]EOO12329.1 hypothetical protein IG9_05619 [Bacillus cereus HuA2-9]